MKTIKYTYIGLLIVGLFSCSQTQIVKEPDKYKWKLTCYYDNNWSHTTVKCDSLQMISISEAIVWVDGKKTKIVGDELRPIHY